MQSVPPTWPVQWSHPSATFSMSQSSSESVSMHAGDAAMPSSAHCAEHSPSVFAPAVIDL